MFLRRVILQSRSDGESQPVQSKALELEQLLQKMPIAGELPIAEECPACNSDIPFRDIRTAACQNGHPWSKCRVVGENFLERFCSLTWGRFQPDARSPPSHSRLLKCERALGVRARHFRLFGLVLGVTHPRLQRVS